MENLNIESLIVKKLTGDLTAQENIAFNSWLESERNSNLFMDLKTIWDETGTISYEELDDIDIEDALKITKQKIETTHKTIDLTKRKRKPYLMAACFTIVALILGGLVLNVNSSNEYTTILASENKEVTLPDNSKVWLSKNAQIKYPNDFKSNRDIVLSGKALFDVTHNPEAPFNIKTEDMKVTVLGTKFIVNDKGDQHQYVQVIDGKVRVEDLKESRSKLHILTKDLAVSRNKEGLLVSDDVIDNSMFWATNTLSFKDESLTKIFDELEDYFDVKISHNSDFKDCMFTGKFANKDISRILESLKIIYNLSIEQVGNNTLNIVGENC